MSKKMKFLPVGTHLVEANGTRYKIRRVIARGGSSVVYEAEQLGKFRIFILKECYPTSKKYFFTRRKKVVCPDNPDDLEAADYLKRVKENMERENKSGQLIANRTGRAVAPWGKLNVTELIVDGKSYAAADSLFIVMERVTDDKKQRGIFLSDLLDECAKEPAPDAPLRNGGCPAPYVATCVIEELLKSLRDIHAANYIHGDINDSNFFLMGHDFGSGDIGVGQLLDFGNAREILADGMTETIKDVFTTPGYYSPEIFFANGKDVRLSAATDIYSVGCLMTYLFFGMKYRKAYGTELTAPLKAPSISIPEAIRHGYKREAAILLKKILGKAFKVKPQERYPNGAAMLEDITRLKTLTAPPKFRLAPNLTRCPYFVEGSRDKELAALQRDMAKGKHPLFIYGVGGIGKTELANEFARLQIKNGTPAYLVTFKGTMRETILSLRFSGYETAAAGSEEDYQRRLNILKEDYQGCLLIVDNFDDDAKSLTALRSEAAYNEVVFGTGMKILFTTRSRPDESTQELMPLDEADALRLFKSVSPVAPQDEPTVRELIREADCHPMTVELLAKTREDSWQVISYKELLTRLRYRRIDDKNLPAVSIKKNMTEREAKIYGHLKTLFDIYKLGEEYRQVICHATLLPIDGFDAATFITNEDADKRVQLKNLESHSWLRRRKEDNLLTIHPLIRNVFRNELRPQDEDCAGFLAKIWQVVDNQYPQDLELFRQAAELFERATNDLSDRRGDFAFYAGFCFIVTNRISSAIVYEDKAVKVREVALVDNPRELARTYNDAGVACMSTENFGVYSDGGLAEDVGLSALGSEHFVKAMDYMGKSMKILESLPDVEDKQNLANVCANIAMSLGNREDLDKALTLAQRAVDIFEKYPPANIYEKAHAHQSLGHILSLKKRYAEALTQRLMFKDLLEKILPTEHPNLAAAYRDLAENYSFLDDFEHAEAYLLKAMEILEKFFPETHPDVLAINKLATEIYRRTGHEEQYKFYYDKGTKILLKAHENVWRNKLNHARRMLEAAEVPVDENISQHNPEVAKELSARKARDWFKYSREAAEACRQLKDYDAAERFITAARAKISQDAEPLEVSLILFTASRIYFGQGKFAEALPVALAAVDKMKIAAPNDFDKLSDQLIHLGNVYSKLGEHDAALASFERAVTAQAQNPNPENAIRELASRSVGQELMNLKRFAEAVKVLEDLLARQRKFLYETQPRVEAVKQLLAQARESL